MHADERPYDGTVVRLESQPDGYTLEQTWTLRGAEIHAQRFPLPPEAHADGTIETTCGRMPCADLQRETAIIDTDHETSIAITWRLGGVVVRRSSHVVLKRGIEALSSVAEL